MTDAKSSKKVSKDVTEPGTWASRGPGLKRLEEAGGAVLLSNSWLNKGTNFSEEERATLGLRGLLPPTVESLDLQAERVLGQLSTPNLRPINRYNILKEIQATNQTLFYKVLIDNINDLAPVVYTPTVGEACRRFDLWYREPMGFYLSAFRDRGKFAEILRHWPSHTVQIIVVTDGSRILGLGDLGTNGMGIPLGKISLFVGAGGFHPEHAMPLVLDAGTNNAELREDKFYMGERKERLGDEEYFAAVDELCTAVREVWPHALLQFEDFETKRAFAILERWRHKMLCFNDDIQGTGAVVAAGIVNGLRLQRTDPAEARILLFGAGSSAVGVGKAIVAYLVHEAGVDPDRAHSAIYLVDSKGLVTTTRGDELPEHKKVFARVESEKLGDIKGLKEIVARVKPHALVGLSAAGPSWGKDVVQEMCRHLERPLIFPLSNPTDKAEITAEEAYDWSEGKAVFAAGSPFDPVEMHGQKFVPGQANNVFIFPGVGFGAVMAKSREVTDQMFTAAAKALAGCVSNEQLEIGRLYPEVHDIRDVSATVAAAVGEAAWRCGVSALDEEPKDWGSYMRHLMWWPDGRTTRCSGMQDGDAGATAHSKEE